MASVASVNVSKRKTDEKFANRQKGQSRSQRQARGGVKAPNKQPQHAGVPPPLGSCSHEKRWQPIFHQLTFSSNSWEVFGRKKRSGIPGRNPPPKPNLPKKILGNFFQKKFKKFSKNSCRLDSYPAWQSMGSKEATQRYDMEGSRSLKTVPHSFAAGLSLPTFQTSLLLRKLGGANRRQGVRYFRPPGVCGFGVGSAGVLGSFGVGFVSINCFFQFLLGNNFY